MTSKKRAPRNRTLTLKPDEVSRYESRSLRLSSPAPVEKILNRTICQDLFSAIPCLPSGFVDLLFLDPPYNVDKTFWENRPD